MPGTFIETSESREKRQEPTLAITEAKRKRPPRPNE